MKPENLDVFNTLLSMGAQPNQSMDIGQGISLARWQNDYGHAFYEQAEHHTLSLYLKGGKGTHKHLGEKSLGHGHPGAICMMPAQVDSEWSIDEPFEFIHFYFDTLTFNRMAVENYDKDPRHLEILDMSFHNDPVVQNIFRNIILPLDWNNPADKFSLSHACQILLSHIFKNYTNLQLELGKSKGGLSPHARRKVKEYIEESLDESFTVDDLARISGLSMYHFTRMFGQSEGISPHQFVLSRRLEKAKNLLGHSNLSLAETAIACGFSSQSHLTKRFKNFTGITPNKFRQLS